MARLELNLLGPFQVVLDGIPITTFESNKVIALLAYLAAQTGRSQRREFLADLIWPGWPRSSAMRNLSSALVDLRKNIADRDAQPAFLLINRESLHLNHEADMWVDVAGFETAISDQELGIINLQSAISLYRSAFMDGFSVPDSAPFEEWLLAKRAFFSQQMLKALSRVTEWDIEQQDYEQAEGYARRQIELEPWREQAYQQLMRALSLKGERVQALAQFESLRRALQRELKVEPSEDTVALYQQIRDGTFRASKKQAVLGEKKPAKPVAEKVGSEVEKPLQPLRDDDIEILRESRPILPAGTVTFLFTDIQGSTPLWEREPEKMAEALQIHNTALRQAIEANGGAVFKTVGDAFQAAFATAPQALKAAIDGQRALQSAPWNELGELKVRIGLHTGEAELDLAGDEYAVSHAKNRIGRIHSAACGGQIILSQETADLVARTLPEGVSLKDLGEHRLKGMQWLEHFSRCVRPGYPRNFHLSLRQPPSPTTYLSK